MTKVKKKKLVLAELERRMLFDASLGALATTTVFAENTVNDTPQILDADVSVTGTTTDFTDEVFSITTDGGADDQISINNEGSGAGQIGFDGTNITYGGTLIGTLSSDGSNGADLTLTLNANASKAAIERLIENITYQNTSDNPTTSRTLHFTLGAFFSEDMTVTVVGQNEAPNIDTNTGLTLNEGATKTITAAELGVSDPDNLDTEVTFTITTDVTNGRLELSSNSGVAITSFTLDQLNSGLVQYVHDGSETTSDSFDFEVSDGSLSDNDTFDITVTPVDDTPLIDANTGTDVFQGLETTIGAEEVDALFGNEVLRRSNLGDFSSFNGTINNQNSQIAIIFTTPSDFPTSYPGQVIYETGGSGRGIMLALDSANQLVWYIGPATNSPRMTSGVALSTDTQYAVVMEIDKDTNEVRMHYQAAGNFNWFSYGRTAEASMAWSDTNNSGSNSSGLGQVGGGSYGGFNGSVSGSTVFQGTIDSDLVITRFPAGGTTLINTKLIATDPDSTDANLIYTITTNTEDGTLYKSGVAIGLNDTFTQDDLDNGLITYTHGGASDNYDSFVFSLSDGTTTLSNQTYDIRVSTSNTAPTLPDQVLQVAEDASNGASVGTLDATDPDVGQTLTYSITGGTGAGIFTIDAATGEITVLDNSSLDYETITSYSLNVRVSDNGPGTLFADRTFTIDILDVSENTAPNFPAQGTLTIGEDAANNDVVGTVTATDPEGQTISYSITGGNTGNVFKINSSTGVISINNAANLDYETLSSYTLTIRAIDNDPVPLSTNRNVTINITDVNEAPTFVAQDVIYILDPSVDYSSATGNFYKYVNSNVNFTNAFDAADDVALNGVYGHLVTITSNAENNFVDSIIGSHIWLAASDAGAEGTWIWLAGPEAGQQFSQGGTAVNGLFEDWNGSEPNSGTNYNYVYMNTNGTWYDQNGTEGRRYVIEWEGSDIINNDTYEVNHTNADASDITNGTSVGFIQGGDADSGDSITYSIEGGNADGIFAVDPNTGEITIVDNTNLNASVLDTYTLTVRATDNSGLFGETDITINFNNALSVAANNALSVDESGTATITTAELDIADDDTAPADIVFTVTSQPPGGIIAFTSAPGVQINSFTLEDIQNNLVIYVHGGAEATSDSFVFSVSDGAVEIAGNTFNIDVNPQNDAPTVSVNTGTTILEGGSKTITSAMLDALDADDTEAGLTYTASSLQSGYIQVNGVTQNTFTQDDIDNNLVVFVHDGSETNGRFNFSLADGGEDSAAAATGSFVLTRTAVNDAPTVLTNAGATVTEGSTVTLNSSNLAGDDVDDTNSTLVYTLSVIQNGQVERSSNPNIPIISFTQADLDAGLVVFRHDGSENVGRFNFSIADGGEDSAAPATGTFTFTINPVNDSPIITTANDTTVDTGNFVILKKAILNTTDPDDSGTGLTYTVDSTTNGQLELLSNPNVAITSFTQADINNSQVVFRHDGTATLTASFDVTVADGGEDSATTSSATINMDVNNTNDSPTITLNSGATMDEGATLNITTAMLDSFDPDDSGTGLTWTVSNVSANGQVELTSDPGVAITSFTQADLDAGLVVFVHDGGETTTASFDVTLADGGENSATTDSATFSITVTPVNEGPSLAITDGTPTVIDFDDHTIISYGTSAGQDGQGGKLSSATVSDGGTTLSIEGNAWKAIALNYTITSDTVLVFEFYSDDIGEISGIGFDTDLSEGNDSNKFQLGGSQSWSGAKGDFKNYSSGDGWVTYEIPVGTFFTGNINYLTFLADDDANGSTSIQFKNVVIYESDADVIHVTEGGTVAITNANLTGTDPDDSGTGLTYSVSNITGGQLELSTDPNVAITSFTQDDIDNGLVVFRHDGSETVSAGFDVSLADGGENGASADSGRLTIVVDQVNDAPTIATNTGGTMNEGGALNITTAMLNEGDNDDGGTDVTYTVSSLSNGHIEVNGVTRTTFTQADINNGIVNFVHDGSETTTAGFNISLADGGENGSTPATGSFSITVNPVNDAPTIATNTGATMNENATLIITSAMLDHGDPDDDGAGLTYTASNLSNGIIQVSGVTQNTFTQADIDNGLVTFVQNGSESASAGFDLSLADGGEDSAVAATGSFAITVNPINDAPTIATNTGATMNEGASLTITSAMLDHGDPDDDGTGLTYTATNLSNGIIQVNGATQNTFTQADIDNGVVVFIHDGSETIAASFDISLADGGENSVGVDTATFNITVSPVNDTPTVAANTGATVLEGGVSVLNNTVLQGADNDNASAGLVYTLTSLPAGTLENTNTSSVLGINSTFTQSDINNGYIRFTHDGGEASTTSFGFTINDGAASTAAQSFTFTITPVNDDPTDITMNGSSIEENMAAGTVVGTLSTDDVDLPGDNFTYSLLDDAGGKFIIVGNELRTTEAFDYEAAQSYDVMVQTDDGNGGIFARMMTIEVTDVSENEGDYLQYREPDGLHREPGAISSFSPRYIEDELAQRGLNSNSLNLEENGFMGAALESEEAFLNAFYQQNLKQMHFTPFGRVNVLAEHGEIISQSFLGEALDEEENLIVQETQKFTTLQDLLVFLDSASDENDAQGENGVEEAESKANEFDRQFIDAMSYQQQKDERLREALSG